jgi:ATP-dependent DNA ligase
MTGYVDDVNFAELEAEKYYAPPKSESKEKTEARASERIFSNNWYGSLKKDGYFSKIIVDEEGQVFIQTRTRSRTNGKFPNKYEHLPHLHEGLSKLPKGTVLLGELYFPNKPGSRNVTTVLGCLPEKAIKRQEKGEKIHLYVFDVLAFNGESFLGKKAVERFKKIRDVALVLKDYQYFDFATYYRGKKLWDKIQEALADGEEGYVLTRADSYYLTGKRTTKDTLKIKKELAQTLDCIIIGANPCSRLYTGKEIETWKYWENPKTGEKLEGLYYDSYFEGREVEPITKNYFYGFAGSLKLGLYDDTGRLCHIGNLSGVTEEIKENWKTYVGSVVEIGAMEVMKTDKGYGLRHPKFLGFRDDKAPTDCLMEQLKA